MAQGEYYVKWCRLLVELLDDKPKAPFCVYSALMFALLSVNIYLKARDLWVVDMFGKCVLCLSITPAN